MYRSIDVVILDVKPGETSKRGEVEMGECSSYV